jgi:hypothetical protein
MSGQPFTYQMLVDLALNHARERGGLGKIVFQPEPGGTIRMLVDGEVVAQGLDAAKIMQASGRLDGPPVR